MPFKHMLNCIALKGVSRTEKRPQALASRMWDRWHLLKCSSLITYEVSHRTGDSIPKVIKTKCLGCISQGKSGGKYCHRVILHKEEIL